MNQLRYLLRAIGFAMGILIGVLAGSLLAIGSDPNDRNGLLLLLAVTVGGLGYIMGPYLKWELFRKLRYRIAEASIRDILSIAVGLAFGSLVAAPLAFIMSLIPGSAGTAGVVAVATATIGLAIMVAIIRRDELLEPWFKPKNPKHAAPMGKPVIIDTNIAIDGRIVDLLDTGFLPNQLLIPRFILDELQHIADSDDPQRRARGRRGLEVLTALRTDHGPRIEIIESRIAEERAVDAKLIKLAKDRHATLLTNDFNLSKVAEMQSVEVLNLNLLSNALRPIVNPGQQIMLKLVQEGRETGQGVGFLDDGTMVVVDGGKSLVGSETPVTITRLLQTGAGRMVFATLNRATA
jgi:uncharacterized protein YacL